MYPVENRSIAGGYQVPPEEHPYIRVSMGPVGLYCMYIRDPVLAS